MITIQEADFNQHELYESLRNDSAIGAIVTFTGLVREFAGGEPLSLEHYPGMTEKLLQNIINEASARWPIEAVEIVHRVGELAPTEQIVFVGVASAHRQAAFEACHYIIDLLKTRAPFWKKEGHTWVEAKESDTHAAAQWLSAQSSKPANNSGNSSAS